MVRLSPRLTPHGRLVLEPAEDVPSLDDDIAARLAAAFAQGSGYGLMRLGAGEIGRALPPALVWWRDFATRYVGALCLLSAGSSVDGSDSLALPEVPPPTDGG